MSDCAFCPIPTNEGPLVEDWGVAVALTPRNPVAAGHVLIIPRKHVADFAEDIRITAMVCGYAAKLAGRYGDCNLITSKGAAATQTVGHLHFHLVPRHPHDQLSLPWTGQPRIGGYLNG